jgi:AcrR family transcriptional regulator
MDVPATPSNEAEVSERPSGGRHLDASRDDALRQAALSLLAEIGYDRLTVDKIAACAGAGKATIYRRWSGKAELVVDALMCQKGTLAIPDTGNLRDDLMALARQATGQEDQHLAMQLMVGLVSALPRDPELREVFHERLVTPYIDTLKDVLARAAARREIAPVADLETVASIIPALVLHRLIVFGTVPDQPFLVSLIDHVILPLVQEGPTASPSGHLE